MTKIFVSRDIIAFLIQAAGAGIVSTGTVEKYNLGGKVTVGGLGVQLLFFRVFVGCCVVLVYSTTGLAGIQPKLQMQLRFSRENVKRNRNSKNKTAIKGETVFLPVYC